MLHPREVLHDPQVSVQHLPVCDHYSGTPERMQKSLHLQTQMTAEFGVCVFDVTLDCEDGAAAGQEAEQAALVTRLALDAEAGARVAVRVHPVSHRSFIADVETIAGAAGHRLTHLMVPKVESLDDVLAAERAVDSAGAQNLPLHVLIESPTAVQHAFEIAAHPRVQSLSFGLMDFVSAHGGAIPSSAMDAVGQFDHPLVVRAKLAIASACHAHGKVPSHCVVTEFSDLAAIQSAASQAANRLGFTRMWSIHPSQIRPILKAFAPTYTAVELAAKIISAAAHAEWAPIRFQGQLHDRASYRYYWQLLERAYRTGLTVPEDVRPWLRAA